MNIALDHVFDWFDARYEARRIWSSDCGKGSTRSWVVEIVADVNLRNHFGLQDGDVIEIRITT